MTPSALNKAEWSDINLGSRAVTVIPKQLLPIEPTVLINVHGSAVLLDKSELFSSVLGILVGSPKPEEIAKSSGKTPWMSPNAAWLLTGMPNPQKLIELQSQLVARLQQRLYLELVPRFHKGKSYHIIQAVAY